MLSDAPMLMKSKWRELKFDYMEFCTGRLFFNFVVFKEEFDSEQLTCTQQSFPWGSVPFRAMNTRNKFLEIRVNDC